MILRSKLPEDAKTMNMLFPVTLEAGELAREFLWPIDSGVRGILSEDKVKVEDQMNYLIQCSLLSSLGIFQDLSLSLFKVSQGNCLKL